MTEKMYTDINSDYLKRNPNWHVEHSPWKASQIMRMLRQNPLRLKTIAEIGCGAGEILNQLHAEMPKDVSFYGYDISADAINLSKSRQQNRLEFFNENMLDLDVKYDCLLMIDVFEHVEDYFGFLRASKSKSDYTIFHIPLDISINSIIRNNLIFFRNSVGHLHHFNKETALATLTDCGYDIIDCFYTAGSFDLPLNTLNSKISFLPRKLLYNINKDLAAKVLGGFSLLVLTKN
jgi:hypothetical protein